MVRAAIVAIGVAAVSTATAASADDFLWRDLVIGEAPQQVEVKLKAMDEVKSVKTKMRGDTVREQDINMRDGGVSIFDGHFSITTAYSGLALERVQLASEKGCANTAHDLASKIAVTLADKYSTVLAPLQTDLAFSEASFSSTSTTPTTLTSAYSNGTTVALLTAMFYRTDPPSYVGGSLGRALYQIARNSYEAQSNSCGGTGYLTARLAVTYLPQSVWDAGYAKAKADAEGAAEQAHDNL